VLKRKADKPSKRYIAVIADMAQSRQLEGTRRQSVQRRFGGLLDHLNTKFKASLAAKFVVTLGDEFQALLTSAEVIPDLLWESETLFRDRQLRFGFGFGEIYTDVPEYAINVDGPALHHAREAILLAKKKALLGGVFKGFERHDEVLNGFARLLQFHRSTLSPQQAAVLQQLYSGKSRLSIAKSLGVTRQAVSRYLTFAGWKAYEEGDRGWRSALHLFEESVRDKS
jgi:hypothetical protein